MNKTIEQITQSSSGPATWPDPKPKAVHLSQRDKPSRLSQLHCLAVGFAAVLRWAGPIWKVTFGSPKDIHNRTQ